MVKQAGGTLVSRWREAIDARPYETIRATLVYVFIIIMFKISHAASKLICKLFVFIMVGHRRFTWFNKNFTSFWNFNKNLFLIFRILSFLGDLKDTVYAIRIFTKATEAVMRSVKDKEKSNWYQGQQWLDTVFQKILAYTCELLKPLPDVRA